MRTARRPEIRRLWIGNIDTVATAWISGGTKMVVAFTTSFVPASTLHVRPARCSRRPRYAQRNVQMGMASGGFATGVEALEHEGAYAVLAAANELEAKTGKSVVHLEIGQPGFATPAHAADAGVAAIRGGQTKYSSPAGVGGLRAAIAERTTRTHAVKVGAENVVVGPGAKPGLFFATLALVRGLEDEVIIPDPGFPTYGAMVAVAGGTCRPVPLSEDLSSFNMDVFRASVGPRTRLVVLNSPANPTGGVMPAKDIAEIARLAKLHDFWVLSDEIYSQLVYDGEYSSILSEPGMLERTVLVDGFSKSYCMTGWRLGWAVMPEALAERVELLITHSVGCTATFTQAAGLAALQGPDDGVSMMREAYRRRRDLVVDAMNAIEGVHCATPAGAFYAFPDVSALGLGSGEVAKRLLEEGFVATLPGTDFGAEGEGFIRISYVSEEEVLQEGLSRITTVLNRIRSEKLSSVVQ